MIFVAAACSNGERVAPATDAAVVPQVVGKAVPDAIADVQAAGLRPELDKGRALDACDTGTVAAQDEASGSSLVRGSTVVLTVTGCPT